MDARISATMNTEVLAMLDVLKTDIALYLEAAKARLASLVLLTTLVGYVLGAHGGASGLVLLATMLGTALTAFGANILNQLFEVERDRLMKRTANRPLPSKRLSRQRATRWALVSITCGSLILALGANLLTAGLGLFVVVLYIGVYTPLKVRTPLNTVAGSVVGAIPPMMGWTAATNSVDTGAWILFGVLFLWQIPHFLALAWMYRDDYALGGFKMLPSVDASGAISARIAIVYTCILIPLTSLATLYGVSGTSFLIGSTALGLVFLALGINFLRTRSRVAARKLFFASIMYLPLLLGLMVADVDNRIARSLTGIDTLSAPAADDA